MKTLLILGAGTGGTIIANTMRKRFDSAWRIVVVDPHEHHLYQPGLLFLPFGRYDAESIQRPRNVTLADGVEWLRAEAFRVDTDARRVELVDADPLEYDLLVIASGAQPRPELTEGLIGEAWGKTIFEFYTLPGAVALRDALERFEGGRLVVSVLKPPIKCPVAPIEFLFLADEYFRKRGIRDAVELVYATQGETVFAKPLANERITPLLREKGIALETSLQVQSVDGATRVLREGEREVPFDLLVVVPVHAGARFVERSGFGDAAAFVRTDPRTLAVEGLVGVFAIGDATNLPTSKAGSVAHFEADVLAENLTRSAEGKSPDAVFDGHANCFVETGDGKALLLDFNYETQPLPGHYPTPWGPFTLLGESRVNHWGKLAFHWLYWNALLPNRPLPVSGHMSLSGKVEPPNAEEGAARPVAPTLRTAGLALVSVGSMVLLMMWLAGGFADRVQPRERGPLPAASADVARLTVVETRVPVVREVTGAIAAEHETVVAAQLLGRVLEARTSPGQRVEAGALLIRLDAAEHQARLDQATAGLREATDVLARISKQRRAGTATEQQLVQARSAEESAQAKVTEARTIVGYTQIRAPVAGVVIERACEVGDTVMPGKPLVRLYDRLQLVAIVPESLKPHIAIGREVEVRIDALGKGACAGTISEIVPQADVARSFRVKVTGACPPGLIPGMFGRMRFTQGERLELRVPESSVRRVGQIPMVFRVLKDGALLRQFVRLGESSGDELVVSSGLSAGDVIIRDASTVSPSGGSRE